MLILERFEDGFAVMDDGDNCFTVKRELVAADVREGDVLERRGELYCRNDEETILRRKEILRLQEGLWK